MIDKIYTNMSFYQKSLEGLWKRNEIISNNIANSDSKDYLAKDINFEEVMENYLDNLNKENFRSKDIDKLKYSINYKKGLSIKSDGNNINVDKEMVSLAENQMKYDLASQAFKFELNLLNTLFSKMED